MNRTLSALLLLVLSADALLLFMVPVMVYGYTSSLAWSGLAYAMAWLPRLVVTPLVGASLDHWGVRRVCVVSDLVKLGSCLGVSLLFWHEPSALMVTLCCGLLGGLVAIGNAQSLIAYEKMIALLSDDVDRDVNILCRIDQSAMVVGPLAGFLGYAVGAPALLAMAGALYALNAGAYGFSRALPRDAAGRECVVPSPLRDNLKFVLCTPLLLSTVLLAVGNNAFDGLVEAGAVTLIDRAMHLPIQYFAFVDICAGVCGVGATLLYPKLSRAMPALKLFVVATAFTVLASALMIVFQAHLAGFLTLYALNIGGKVFMGNFCRSLRIRIVPATHLGRVSSLMLLMNQAILPVVGLVLYLVGEQRQSLSLLMFGAVAVTVLATLLIRYHMRTRSTAARTLCR